MTLSKLADLVHSSQFSMLLLTESRSRGATNVRGTSGTGYGDLVKNRRFGPFWLVFYAITHLVWFLGRSEYSTISGDRLRGPRQNWQIWSILASFLCYYSPTFGPGELRTFRELRGPVMGTSSKLVDLVRHGQFSMLLHTDSGSRGSANVRGTSGTSSKIADLYHSGQFSMLLLIYFGSWGESNILRTPGTVYGDLVKTRRFGPFC